MPVLLIQPYWDAAKPSLIVFLFSLCMVLVLYFRRPNPRFLFGKRWVYPAGPRGQIVVGNLLQMRRVRRDTVGMAAYVGSKSVSGISER